MILFAVTAVLIIATLSVFTIIGAEAIGAFRKWRKSRKPVHIVNKLIPREALSIRKLKVDGEVIQLTLTGYYHENMLYDINERYILLPFIDKKQLLSAVYRIAKDQGDSALATKLMAVTLGGTGE